MDSSCIAWNDTTLRAIDAWNMFFSRQYPIIPLPAFSFSGNLLNAHASASENQCEAACLLGSQSGASLACSTTLEKAICMLNLWHARVDGKYDEIDARVAAVRRIPADILSNDLWLRPCNDWRRMTPPDSTKFRDFQRTRRFCLACSAVEAFGGEAMKRCQGCRIAAYCSRSCQTIHWPVHKVHCNSWAIGDVEC